MLSLSAQEVSTLQSARKQSEKLLKTVQAVHTAACFGNPLLELLIRDIFRSVNDVRNRLNEVTEAIPSAEPDEENDFPNFKSESN